MPQKRREWPRRKSVEAADNVGLGGIRLLLALLRNTARGGHCHGGVLSHTVAANAAVNNASQTAARALLPRD